jgi:hypothetical protein
VGYDWVCPFQEVSPDAAASAEATPDQPPSTQSPTARAPSAGEDPIVVPKMRVRRTQGPTRRDWTPPGPSKLRETVQAQGDEKLNKVYRDFERFRITGKQPPVSVPIGGPQITQYSPLGSSTYRPFSAPLNVTDPMRRDGRQDASGGTRISTSRRLGSNDLFPDRYRQESRPVVASTEARDSIVEDNRKPATRDSAPARDSIADESPKTATPDSAPSVDTSVDASIPPYPQSEIDSRRAAAKPDGSDRSSTSSTESSRARRRSLAYSLDKDKAAWSPNVSKSTASVSFAGFKNAMRTLANTFMPPGDKSEAENLTRELSLSPRRFGDRADGRGYDSDTEQAGENARPVSSSRRRSRKNTVAGPSSGDRAGGRVDGSDTEQAAENARPANSSRRRSRKDGLAGSSSGGCAGHDGASDTEQTVENARPVNLTRRHSRKDTIAGPSGGGRAGHDDGSDTEQAIDNARLKSEDDALMREVESLDEDTILARLGILPSPPKPSSPVLEEATNNRNVVSGKKQGPTTSEFRVLVS